MAEIRRIVVDIRLTEGDGEIPVAPQDNKQQKKAENEGKLLWKSVILNQGYQTAKKLVIQGVEASINHYMTLTEDYMAENTYNKVKVLISKGTSFTSMVAGGAVTGMVGGPVGAVVGATIGAIGFGVSEFINYQSRMSGYYRSLNASNIEMNYARKRAGLYDNGKGTEN